MLDVQINTARFLDIMSRMALLFHDKEDAGIYRQKADELKEKINSEWWIGSENRYADFIAPKDKALKIIEDALTKRVVAGRNDWAKAKLENLKQQVLNNDYPYKGYVVYYNPSGLLPMETGLADPERSGKMLKHAKKRGGFLVARLATMALFKKNNGIEQYLVAQLLLLFAHETIL